MTPDALGWYVAAVFFAWWFIEHIGGREIRDELRDRLAQAEHTRDLALDVLRAVMRPTKPETAAKVIEFRGRG